MINLPDMHMHSSFSSDSDAPMEQMIRQAVRLQLPAVCFTEHMDPDYPPVTEDDGSVLTFLVDIPSYFEEYTRLKEKYREEIRILFGLEMGMQTHLHAYYQNLISEWPFDFLIASQHLVAGADPYYENFWSGQTPADKVRQYFLELYDNICHMPDFDTAAHLDYIVRYAPRDFTCHYDAYADVIDLILREIIRREKCLEVNTSGLRSPLGHTNPAAAVLERYYALGGRLITLGSDAHKEQDIASHFSDTVSMLRNMGFTHTNIFESRKRKEIRL